MPMEAGSIELELGWMAVPALSFWSNQISAVCRLSAPAKAIGSF
jgi:hypothetical protein